MTALPVKYFSHYLGRRQCLSVHRLDELVQITFAHGPDDENPEVIFFAPTSAHALVEAIDHAARDAQAVFEASTARAERSVADLPAWGPAFLFGGLPPTLCPAGDGEVATGQSAKPETATGRIWHDDCAEAAGAYRQSLTCPPSSAASAPPGERSAVASSGGAHGAAGADRASAGPPAPAAPSLPGRS